MLGRSTIIFTLFYCLSLMVGILWTSSTIFWIFWYFNIFSFVLIIKGWFTRISWKLWNSGILSLMSWMLRKFTILLLVIIQIFILIVWSFLRIYHDDILSMLRRSWGSKIIFEMLWNSFSLISWMLRGSTVILLVLWSFTIFSLMLRGLTRSLIFRILSALIWLIVNKFRIFLMILRILRNFAIVLYILWRFCSLSLIGKVLERLIFGYFDFFFFGLSHTMFGFSCLKSWIFDLLRRTSTFSILKIAFFSW